MPYKPTKKEIEQILSLNKGYKLMQEGMGIIKEAIPKQDSEIEMQFYKMARNFEKVIERTKKLLEKHYIDKEFLDIIEHSIIEDVNNSKPKKKPKKITKKPIKKPKKNTKKKTPIKKTTKKKPKDK